MKFGENTYGNNYGVYGYTEVLIQQSLTDSISFSDDLNFWIDITDQDTDWFDKKVDAGE